MTTFVIDASIAVKWVLEEPGTPEALALRGGALLAPDLLIPECANILWKKLRLGELSQAEASAAAQLLERADIELCPMRAYLHAATALAIELDHPAYDCIYVALAMARGCVFATADRRLVRKSRQVARSEVAAVIVDLPEAAASI